jgi:excisionase family DNA binding protein
MDEILTLSEFAKKIQVSRPTVIKLIESGVILAFRLSSLPGAHYRIKASEVEKLIAYRLDMLSKHKKEEKL